MPASNYVKEASLAAWLNGQAFTLPSSLYVGLFLTNPGANNSGTEVSGSGYARATLQPTAPSISGDLAVCSNNAVVQFNEATGAWGTPTYFGVFDALTGGNLLFYGSLPTTFAVTTGMAPKFNIGELRLTSN